MVRGMLRLREIGKMGCDDELERPLSRQISRSKVSKAKSLDSYVCGYGMSNVCCVDELGELWEIHLKTHLITECLFPSLSFVLG